MPHRLLLAALACLLLAQPIRAAELAVLTNQNWDRLAPAGKEADCILGDYAFRSDRLLAVVAQPLPTRHANMTVRQVGGAVIDLTLVDQPNDQLSAFYPGMRRHAFDRAEIVQAKGSKVILHCRAPARSAAPGQPAQPEVRLEYELEDGQPYLLIRSVFTNPFDQPLEFVLEDDLRADNFDQKVLAGPTDLFWVHDHYFRQAYGLLADGHTLRSRSDPRNSVIQYYPGQSESNRVRLEPGRTYELVRRLIPGASLLAVKGHAARLRGRPTVRCGYHFVDPLFKPVAGADVTIKQGETVYGTARTDDWGWVRADLPLEKFTLTCKAVGRGTLQKEIDLTGLKKDDVIHTEYEMEAAAVVVAEISDEEGGPIPCKVAFKGQDGTDPPNWGPPSAAHAVVNLYYSHDGRFTVPINPGSYEAIISYGPEYHVVRVPLKVARGARVPLRATLRRAFTTPGWVSADFHSHSSPSGDNTSDQRGRVLNLLAEHIEFAPCTEHNRLDTYLPHLKALGVERLMGTCTGIELTGQPLPLNHQNAFPLRLKPRTQDGGAPQTDADPQKQIRRLFEWDDKAEKLVQQNHPDIGWLFFDKDGDGQPDGGYHEGFPFMHVIEVHPIDDVLSMEPYRLELDAKKVRVRNNHRVFNWLQLLNQGHRIPGVVNTDAHYNYHGSGGLRNYVRCDAAVPGAIDPLEIVRHAKKGHLVMSNGPFLEVKLNGALPGDDLRLEDGKGTLQVRVCCPNWFDIDRVQVLLNGRPDPRLNFTRKTHPQLFGEGAVRFDQKLALALDRDAHVIVVAVGEGSTLGEVMGPMWGRQNPAAISNPIFVDVDGGGFKANGDTLGAPLPVKGGQPVK
ncbi:MAG TPA: CehA/McbA family metallohydrolase [Gemmataceae bacterium]|nr:CehA/McbA family metallohydrolase [Gemmataceae bacterium]